MAAGLVSSSPEPCPVMGPLSQAHVLSQTQLVPILKEVPSAQGWGCPDGLLASLVEAGMGPGFQALPSPTMTPAMVPAPQGSGIQN